MDVPCVTTVRNSIYWIPIGGGNPPRDVNVLMYMLPWVLDLGGPSVPGRGPFVTNICRAIFWAQDKYLSYTFAQVRPL